MAIGPAYASRRGRFLAAAALLVGLGAGGLATWLQWAPDRGSAGPLEGVTVPLPPAPAQPQPNAATPNPAAAASVAAPPPMPAPKPPAPERTGAEALAPAPDPALVEKSAAGLLPVVGTDGRMPWQVYARPFDRSDRRPRVAIMVTGLGQSKDVSETAIDDLAGAVTLVFSPYAARLETWVQRARAAGHETFLSLPLEPIDYPRADPGPHTLLTSLDPQQNLERLQWVLSRVTGYVGVATAFGSRFTTSKGDLLPVLDVLRARGLMFVDSRVTKRSVAGALAKSIALPRATNDVLLDEDASRDAIDARLQRLEALARQNGVALGMGYVYPVTLERIGQWTPTLEGKGLALAPASATADLQPERTVGAGR